MIHLITGYAGYEHIQSEDEGAYNASFFGDGQYVMQEGSQFEGSILDNNTVRILDGNLLMYGRHIRIARGTYEDLIIQTGTAGKNRIDLICMTYAKNDSNGTEQAYLQVIKGIETTGTAVVPVYTDGNILEGAILNNMPLYKVVIEGIYLKELVPMFTVIPTYKTLAEQYAKQFEATIKALKDADILDTMEEIEANTKANMFAGALAVKELDSVLYNHTSSKSNPHNVTKKQVGLENVPNVATNDQTPTYTEPDNPNDLDLIYSGEKLGVTMGKISAAIRKLWGHLYAGGGHEDVSIGRKKWSALKPGETTIEYDYFGNDVSNELDRIADEVYKINSDIKELTTQIGGTVTWNTTNKTAGSVGLWKIGRFAQLTLEDVSYSDFKHGNTMLTVPEAFKPLSSVRVVVGMPPKSSSLSATEDWTCMTGQLGIDGRLVFYSTSSGANVRIAGAKATLTYITKE